MKVLILGGNGYLGQATAEYLRANGFQVTSIDSDIKSTWMKQMGVRPLIEPEVDYDTGDAKYLREEYYAGIDAVVHYAEQPSAPFSMYTDKAGFDTVYNNITTTLDMILNIRKVNPACHIVKLGTMGEYGTPGVDIPEGYFTYHDRGGEDVVRSKRMLFPKQPGSLYHTTKVMDSDMIEFGCRVWGLKATDLHQGVVYGSETDEMRVTRFYYDAVFGTVLNRFVVQAAMGMPLTVYGKGGQTRGYLNIRDTLQCVRLAIENPPKQGEYRVLNQFTQTFSVQRLAEIVKRVTGANITSIPNPRKEMEDHYYWASNEGFKQLGLRPHLLDDSVIEQMVELAKLYADRVDEKRIRPEVRWVK